MDLLKLILLDDLPAKFYSLTMKKLFFLILLITLLLSISSCVMQPGHGITDNDIGLVTVFKGSSTWEYTVKVLLPNPCYDIATDVFVMESYPEQVLVEVEIIPPTIFEACIQVITEKSITGTFQASDKASITASVKE